MKKLIVVLVAVSCAAMFSGCLEESEQEGCSVPEITAVNYLPRNPGPTDAVTVTAKIKNDHCPFQAQVTYQVAEVGEEWSNSADSYESTAPVHSTVAGETCDFEAKIPAAGSGNRKVRFVIEVVTQHLYYLTSELQEYTVFEPVSGDGNE